jgi:glucose/arabinose dehydrogenase
MLFRQIKSSYAVASALALQLCSFYEGQSHAWCGVLLIAEHAGVAAAVAVAEIVVGPEHSSTLADH